MMFVLIMLVVVGARESASTPGEREEPLQCGPNSHFEQCSKICPPQNCSALIDPYWLCENPRCKPECRCNDGYVRDDRTGFCISRDECLAQCGPLERFVKDSPECQRTCANYKVTGPQSLCKPFTGCVCEKGRVRLNDNATGACVLPKDCPRRQCPLREHWEDCPSVCAKETCISKNPDYKCLLPAIPLPCKPRCICDKGYLRNHLGQCIPENHCPIKRCPINEVWRCASMCSRDSCKRLEPGFKCPPGIISVCIPVCACKDGYLRNDRGLCIPRELCPASLRCDINEVAVECQAYPPQTCESVYTVYKHIKDPPCIPGCDCRPGYLRNKRNICVPSEFCPTVPQNLCGSNQEYKECGTTCEPSCADLDNPPQVCPDVCVEGCFCKDGYLKDDCGNCVPRNQCPLPVCNKPNEVAKDCGSYCERKTCENYNRTDIACPAVCVRGCFCRDGYVRNAYGVCIHPKKCPHKPVCLQEHEEYQSCGSSCPDNCDNYMKPDRICTMNCVAGCNCIKGYVRNLKDNTCIKPEQCPYKECTGQNEELNYCASYCPVTCANRYTLGDWSCITLCRVACDCIPGTLRDDNGVCVPVEQCTPPVCRQNEKYMKCGTACPLTCDNYKKPPPCTHQCIEDCFCEDGYVRDRFMRCVKPENCEPICPAGEKFNECSAHCQDTCENYNVTNRICTYQCQSGCVCEEGTVRRKDGQCVPPSQCTDTITCRADEIYDPCSAHCEPTCEHHGPDRACTAICKPGCRCGDGLVRRKDGKCVKLEECPPPVCGQNEKYMKCGTACPLTCDNYKKPPPCTHQCVEDCFCEDGYVRDRFMRCVKPENCEPICPAGEKFNECSAHCQDTCENYNVTNRICTRQCQSGCVCEEGTVRRKDGQCVPPSQCTDTITCRADEIYDPCSAHCEPTCEHHGPDRGCTAICKPGCKCGDGLVRRKDGKCVKLEECPPTCPPSEHYDECNAHCEDTCELHGSNVTCLPYCNAGCQCDDGLVRRKDGQCVPLQDCSGPLCSTGEVYDPCPPIDCPPGYSCAQVCRPGCKCADGLVRCEDGRCAKREECDTKQQCPNVNERWVDCVLGLCIPMTCDELGFPIGCPGIIGPCKGGCVCAENYVRDSNNICIPKQDCPSCGNDFNATSGCGIHCGRQCTDYKNKPNCNIPLPCQYNGCDCKQGYVYDIVTERCVASIDCPIPCNGDLYAEKVKCPNPCPATCAKPTTAVCPRACLTEGCQCRSGFVLSPDGKCIRPEKCPDDLGCNGDPNSRISSCVSLCEPTCGFDPIFCPAHCRLGCACKTGFILSNDGICIKPEQCSIGEPCADPNAVRKKCASHESCRATCAVPNSKVCPKICIIDGCECKKGYVLSAKGGTCVKIQDCPQDNVSCNGDPNAVIRAFPQACPSTCELPNGIPGCLKLGLDVGCECKPGYLKADDNGKCILPDDCKGGDPCGVNATFSSCTYHCAYDYCPVNDQPIRTPCEPTYPCPSGCVCKLNYKRKSKEDDRCIISSTCPPVKCTRPNEIWDPCPSACLREECVDVNNQPTTCNTLILNCQPRCICKKGYFRNNKDICIPAKDCTINKPCDDPNAERLECAPAPSCRSTCATPDPSPCVLSCAINECVCKKGYVLSAKGGKCIPVDQCPKDAPCNGDSNAVIKVNPIPCPSTCSAPNASPWCKRYAPPVGCECKPGYLQAEEGGKCIKPEECPGGNPCGVNSTFVWCKASCPTDYCPVDDSRAMIACDPPYPCPSGCVCKLNYRRKSVSDDRCILASTCPPVNCTRRNEIWDSCPSECRRESCTDVNDQPTTCNTLVLNCQPQCVCKSGYFRNDTDICIPGKDCPNNQCSDPNAERVKCALATQCRPTCAVPTRPCYEQICIINDCVCKQGYVLSEKGGKCVTPDQCPRDAPCNGDSNAVIKAKPIPCPSTCSAPNASPWCRRYAPPVGCVCKPGYLLAEYGGKCIKPQGCPGGNPCGQNATFVECTFNCPSNNCPVDDSGAIVACSPPNPCPSGCACKKNYKRKSNSDNTCILASDCPKNKTCSDPNAERVQCAPALQCRPTCAVRDPGPCIEICVINDCVCKKGYILSEEGGKCILEDQCPNNNQCSDPNAERVECALPTECRPTCAVPNPRPCIEQICIKNDCVCKQGYVLSEKGGKCVTADQCLIQKSCNGDPNAQIKECPLPCPATCDAPNAIPCRKACVPIGCECKDGYILSETNGKCILPEKCKGGYPCGRNETFVSCKVPCPSDYCPVGNSPNRVNCETPNPCYPGCVCKINHRRKSVDDRRCIYASECPPQKCNKNEVWSGCPSECLQEDCSNANDPPVVCNTLLLNCQPKCICKKGHYRDSARNCVPACDCPKPIQCKANEVYRTCRIICPPQTCASIYTSYDCRNVSTRCEPGCDCINEYLRNGTENDPCIPSSQCPTTPPVTPECGIHEHYETNRNNCELTCKNYEYESVMGPCPLTSGCFCDTGYVRNSNGLCIRKKKCPQNIVCPPNEVLSECYNSCHMTCKTRLRSDGKMCHLACTDTGCLCKEGYLRHDNGTCVPISKCSPPRCNDDETYSSCGTACPPTCKNRGDNCTACTDQCVEDCFCKKGLVRADDGTCVKPKDCPKRTCSGPHEVFDECPPSCPPTDGWCSSRYSKFNCTNAVRCCKPQCRCRSPYLRNENGICVLPEQC